MGTGSALRELATFVEACESGEGTVTGVCFAECVGPTDDALTAEVELTLAADAGGAGAVSLRTRIDDDGRLSLALESGDAVVPTEGHDVAVEPVDVTVDDGTVSVTLSASAPTGDAGPERGAVGVTESDGGSPPGPGPSADSETRTADGGDAGDAASRSVASDGTATAPSTERDREVPPFRDRDLLAEVYESEGTFAEMADALEMDVTAETVRRYMIDYDIHEPDSYDTGGESGADHDSDANETTADDASVPEDPTRPDERTGTNGRTGTDDETAVDDATTADGAAATDGTTATDDATDDSPVVLSDGIGLPDDVTVDTLIESVKRSNTIYEVTRDVDMDRHEALEMLQDLNLLDLVIGRLSTETDRNITREDVVARLREASATH